MLTKLSLLILLIYSSAVVANLKIVSYNIRNYDMDFRFDRKTDKAELTKILSEVNADIFGVQEIVNYEDFEIFIKENLPKYKVVLTTCGGAGRQRLGFLYNTETITLDKFYQDDAIRLSPKKCTQGVRPAAIAHFKVIETGFSFSIINVHLKAGSLQKSIDMRLQQYEVIGHYVRLLEQEDRKNIVVLGDFNSTDYTLKNENYQAFVRFMNKANLYNFSDELSCTAYWYGGKSDGLDYPAIIDHILVTENFYSNFNGHKTKAYAHCEVAKCEVTKRENLGISYSNVSDHCPISTTLF